jgi:hypothetical protein
MTANIPEAGRQAANVILDAISAHAIDDDQRGVAMELALSSLAEVEGAYRVTLGDDDEVSLDLTNLVGGTMVAMSRLVQLAAEGHKVSREEIISDLREWLG